MDNSVIPSEHPAGVRSPKSHRATKPQLLTREQLDGRTNAAKAFNAIAEAIARDLGGEAALTTVQRHLVEAFAGVAITVSDMNARKALGQTVDLLQQSQAISTMVRLATRIGVRRIARDVGPDIGEYLEHRAKQREAIP